MTPQPLVLEYDVIVPAVMGVGILLSLLTVVRDEVDRLRGHAGQERRMRARARAAAVSVTRGTSVARADVADLRGRLPVAALGLALVAFSLYLVPGATWNYVNPVERFRHIAWLWGASLTVVLVAGTTGLVLLSAARRWPDLPAAARPVLVATTITARPRVRARQHDGAVRRRRLVVLAAILLTAFGLLSAFVALGSPAGLDRALEDALAKADALRHLRWLNPFSETETALAASAVVGIATWRCPPFALAYLLSIGAAWALSVGVNGLVDRPRPVGWTGDLASFPSGHITTAALMTGLLPLGALVLTRRRWVGRTATVLLGTGLVGILFDRFHIGAHFPLDALGSLLLAGACVAVVRAYLLHSAAHTRCRRCPWQSRPG